MSKEEWKLVCWKRVTISHVCNRTCLWCCHAFINLFCDLEWSFLNVSLFYFSIVSNDSWMATFTSYTVVLARGLYLALVLSYPLACLPICTAVSALLPPASLSPLGLARPTSWKHSRNLLIQACLPSNKMQLHFCLLVYTASTEATLAYQMNLGASSFVDDSFDWTDVLLALMVFAPPCSMP
jgi:hypothetical protein